MRRLKKAYYILIHSGPRAALRRAAKYMKKSRAPDCYADYIKNNEPSQDALLAQRAQRFENEPLISFVCPAYNTKKKFARALIASLEAQTYPYWELCVADAGGGFVYGGAWKRLSKLRKVHVVKLDKNLGIGNNTAHAVRLARGRYIAFVDHDDALAPDACYELVKTINEQPDADFIYTDEDKFDSQGRFSPHFKPDWSPDTLLSYNYITHLMVLERGLYERAGGITGQCDGSQDHDLALRASKLAKNIVHIPRVLYHWRSHKNSVAGDGMCKQYAFEAGKRAVSAAAGAGAKVEDGLFPASYRVRYRVRSITLVSVIIPNHEKPRLIRQCVESVLDTADLPVEILIVENGSSGRKTFAAYEQLSRSRRVKLIFYRQPFNYSAINNYAAARARGSLLLFLNNDVRVPQGENEWLSSMAEHALRPEIGAVGAKLLYGDHTVQHAGVVVGMGGWADHVCAGVEEDGGGRLMGSHLINTVRNVSAVTGACLMCGRSKFERLGGFDERFELCGSDVELCLRFLAAGYRNIYTPYARLEHLESATRQQKPVPAGDYIRSLDAYRPALTGGDPYYSLNFDYSSRLPRAASIIAPPSALNPMLSGGV